VLGGKCCRPAPFPTESQSLHGAKQHEQDGRPDSDRIESGEAPDEEGSSPHEQQRRDEHLLAPDGVAEPAEDDPAERADDERNAVRHERQQQADAGFGFGEEDCGEHQCGR
jgi:hypothetical protein